MSCLIKEVYNMNVVHSLTGEEFKILCKSLEKIATDRGYKYGIITTQIKLETGSGKKIIDKNLFNIKATGSWLKSGRFVEVGTTEYENGIPVKQPAKFRKYQSYEESLKDYLNLISGLSRYKTAWNNRHNPNSYFNGLYSGGYATDPIYSDKLKQIYNQNFA